MNIDDFEILLVALKSLRLQHWERLKEAERLSHEAQVRRYQGYVNRSDNLSRFFLEKIKEIRAEKFEAHRKTRKYWRGVLGNSRLIK